MSALFLAPQILALAAATTTTGFAGVSPAQAACDEQAGEFHREGPRYYCDVNGVIFEGREEISRPPAQVLAATIDPAAIFQQPAKSARALKTKSGGASRHRRSVRTKSRRLTAT